MEEGIGVGTSTSAVVDVDMVVDVVVVVGADGDGDEGLSSGAGRIVALEDAIGPDILALCLSESL